MSYDLIELTLSRLGEQLPERLSPCLESHQTDRRSDKPKKERGQTPMLLQVRDSAAFKRKALTPPGA
jgi:hypothetical protein